MSEIYSRLGSVETEVSNLKDNVSQRFDEMNDKTDKHYDLLVIIKDTLKDHGAQYGIDKALLERDIKAAHSRLDEIEPVVKKTDTIIGKLIFFGSLVVTGITLGIQWLSPFLARLWP